MKKYVIILILCCGYYALIGQGINPSNLSGFIKYCDSTKADEVVISYQGKIVKHWKRTNFLTIQGRENISECQTSFMGTASMVKSWTGLLIGILIDKGIIQNVDDLVCRYIPD